MTEAGPWWIWLVVLAGAGVYAGLIFGIAIATRLAAEAVFG